MAETAQAECQIDDDKVRVTLWRFRSGTETGWHRHEFPYIVVPIEGGTLTVDDGSKRHPYRIEGGRSYSRPAGVEHNILNETSGEIAFVEIELKG